jgi:hypothetical protein
MLRPKKVGNPKKYPKTVEEPKNPKCYKFEPNPSKDKAMHEGDKTHDSY